MRYFPSASPNISGFGFNISDFASSITQDGVIQTNKFTAIIPNVPGLSPDISTLMAYRGEQCHIPGVTFDMQQINRYGVGPLQKFPTNVNFTENTLTFIDDSQNTIWKTFYNWMNYIFQYTGQSPSNNISDANYTVRYKSDYARNINIHLFNNSGENVTTIVLREAFPISINDINLSWADNNNLFRVIVTFAFTDWYEASAINYETAPLTIQSLLNPTRSSIVPAQQPQLVPAQNPSTPSPDDPSLYTPLTQPYTPVG